MTRLILSIAILTTLSPALRAEPTTIEVNWARQGLGPLTGEALASLALFPGEHPGRLMRCPESPYPDALPSCRYRVATGTALQETPLVAGVVTFANEHDGMYSSGATAVLLQEQQVVAYFDLYAHSVTDCSTRITLRRVAVTDVNRDGRSDLCVESVVEEGQGLFAMLDLGKNELPWFPIVSRREIRAFEVSEAGLREIPADRCPTQPYESLARPSAVADAAAGRYAPQGLRTRLEQCPLTPTRSCFELDSCPGSGTGLVAVPGFSPPTAPPWGPYGQTEGQAQVGLRSRVRMAAQKGSSTPTLAFDDPLLVWYETRNFGPAPVRIWHAGFWPNHQVHLFDDSGHPVQRTTRGRRFDAVFGAKGRGKNAAVELQPGGAVDTQGRYDLHALFKIVAPGLYLLRVDYQDGLRVVSNTLPVWLVPRRVKRLLDKLNGWPADECARHETPEAFPGEKSSGETNGFVTAVKAELRQVGYWARWDSMQRRYTLAAPQAD